MDGCVIVFMIYNTLWLEEIVQTENVRDILNTINYWIIDILNQIRLCSTSWLILKCRKLLNTTTWHLVLPTKSLLKHWSNFGINPFGKYSRECLSKCDMTAHIFQFSIDVFLMPTDTTYVTSFIYIYIILVAHMHRHYIGCII